MRRGPRSIRMEAAPLRLSFFRPGREGGERRGGNGVPAPFYAPRLKAIPFLLRVSPSPPLFSRAPLFFPPPKGEKQKKPCPNHLTTTTRNNNNNHNPPAGQAGGQGFFEARGKLLLPGREEESRRNPGGIREILPPCLPPQAAHHITKGLASLSTCSEAPSFSLSLWGPTAAAPSALLLRRRRPVLGPGVPPSAWLPACEALPSPGRRLPVRRGEKEEEGARPR